VCYNFKADMRILFVVDYIGDDHLGIMGVSSILKQKGYCVETINASPGKIIEKLKDEVPTILAYSVLTPLSKQYLHINRVVKKQVKAFFVFGGPHPSAVPEIVEEDGLDAVCIGEGDYAMLELVDNLSAGRSVANIKNWWVKENGVVTKNSLRPLISDLDRLPFPDRSLFEKKVFFNREKIHIITSRGCPYACNYCFNSHYDRIYAGKWKNVRRRSVENVIKETLQLKKRFPLKFIVFDDSIFGLSREWLKRFSREYKKYVNIPFSCNIRAEHVTDEAVVYLKEAGCHVVSIGIETADEYIRTNILGKNVTRKQILKAAGLIKRHNIQLRTSNIINIPYSTIENDMETLKLNIECNSDYAIAFFLETFPGTKIKKMINVDKGRCLPQLNSSQKTIMENLRSLFTLVAAFPFLFLFVRILIRLPLNRVYRLLYSLREVYCTYFYLYPAGIRVFFRWVKRRARARTL